MLTLTCGEMVNLSSPIMIFVSVLFTAVTLFLTSEEFEMLAYRTKFNEFFTVRYMLPMLVVERLYRG